MHAVQIEVNRALYADEVTGDPSPPGVARVEAILLSLLDALGALSL